MPAQHRVITLALAVLLGLLALMTLQSVRAQTLVSGKTIAQHIEAAVALEQCDGKPFSMIDDIRFGMYLVNASDFKASLAETTADLRAARRTHKADCTQSATQQDMRDFTTNVLPRVRGQR